MTKESIRNTLDYFPLVILIISAIILIRTVVTTDIGFMWKHYVALIMLPLICLAFWKQHKIGVLVLGFTLIAGLLGILSYNQSINTVTLFWAGIDNIRIPVFYGQPIFLLWLLIHCIISGRYYIGILTKQYWRDLFSGSIT